MYQHGGCGGNDLYSMSNQSACTATLNLDTLSIYQILCKSDNIPKCSENDNHLENVKNSSSLELEWLREVQRQGS